MYQRNNFLLLTVFFNEHIRSSTFGLLRHCQESENTLFGIMFTQLVFFMYLFNTTCLFFTCNAKCITSALFLFIQYIFIFLIHLHACALYINFFVCLYYLQTGEEPEAEDGDIEELPTGGEEPEPSDVGGREAEGRGSQQRLLTTEGTSKKHFLYFVVA